MMRSWRSFVFAVALAVGCTSLAAQEITLPNKSDSLRFAIIGDSGTGDANQLRVAQALWAAHQKFPYEFVLMMGDNIYGGEATKDFDRKFLAPYKPILGAGIKFYAALGNHDTPNQAYYKQFNMNGERFYTFKPKNGVRFFALDSNYMDPKQLVWLEKELAASGSDWKIAFFHHPIYSSGGTHGSDLALRDQLEPLFLKYKVDAVFAGHDQCPAGLAGKAVGPGPGYGGWRKTGRLQTVPGDQMDRQRARQFLLDEFDRHSMFSVRRPLSRRS